MKFSERYGYKPIREIIQIDSMDEPLRNALWSILKVFCWDNVRHSSGMYGGYFLSSTGNEEIQSLCKALSMLANNGWHQFCRATNRVVNCSVKSGNRISFFISGLILTHFFSSSFNFSITIRLSIFAKRSSSVLLPLRMISI